MAVRLVGANPGLRLYDGEQLTAYASAWRVDWSERGSGHALVLWQDGRTRLITAEPQLGRWLTDEFTRHFPEVRGLPWPAPEVTVAPVQWRSDLAHGVHVSAADVVLEIGEPLGRELVRVPDFDLGGHPHLLSTVLIPCRSATLRIGDARVPGAPRVPDDPPPRSTAFLADAEVWCHAAG